MTFQLISIVGSISANESIEDTSSLEANLHKVFTPMLKDVDAPLLNAHTLVTSKNVDQYSPWMDEVLFDQIKKGGYEMEIGRALDFPIHPYYFDATKSHFEETRILSDVGEIINYHGGRPFVELDKLDPLSGIKAAWNMRYAYAPDETETLRFIWRYRDMAKDKIERTLKMYGSILRYKHRHTVDPIPSLPNNPSNLYTALYLKVNHPQDIRNTQLLIHRAEDDAAPEQAWIYLNTQRRVKRLATGQKTDAFLGSDIMIEDFLGYNGRIRDMDWKFIAEKEMLLAMYAHNELLLDEATPDASGYAEIEFGGQGHCFPKVTWQLRKVYVIDAYPKDPSHPLSRRRFIIDAATFVPALTQIYDNSGKIWKLAIAAITHSDFHTPENKAWQGAITEGVTMIDLQARHCTTLHLKTQIANSPLKNKDFTTANLRQRGR